MTRYVRLRFKTWFHNPLYASLVLPQLRIASLATAKAHGTLCINYTASRRRGFSQGGVQASPSEDSLPDGSASPTTEHHQGTICGVSEAVTGVPLNDNAQAAYMTEQPSAVAVADGLTNLPSLVAKHKIFSTRSTNVPWLRSATMRK